MNPSAHRPLSLHNRKYLGAKYRLLDHLVPAIRERSGPVLSFADLFAGTGVVAAAFNGPDCRLLVNDQLPSNAVILRAYLGTQPGEADPARLAERMAYYNGLPPRDGYYCQAFGGTYFTVENAGRIEAVRTALAEDQAEGRITSAESDILLASLLLACDKVANTVGQYDAFLKNLAVGEKGGIQDGVHLVDRSVYRPLHLRPLAFSAAENRGNRCLAQCARSLAGEVHAQVVYLDPPYNTRQYADNYHVLDNIALHRRPALRGKTRKPEGLVPRSPFSRRRQAADALAEVVERVDCAHLFVSYNSEGILSHERIVEILERRGAVEVVQVPYPVFGRGAGKARRRMVIERLYACRVAGTTGFASSPTGSGGGTPDGTAPGEPEGAARP